MPNRERPVALLVSPAGRTERVWYVRAYHTRWGGEDANRRIKQRFGVEGLLVRSWRSIRRLRWLAAWAFGWRNPWGAASLDRLRAALMNHPWRRKPMTDRFNWIATLLRELLHPHPKLATNTG